MKFKVGDRVRIVGNKVNFTSTQDGDVGTVVGTDRGHRELGNYSVRMDVNREDWEPQNEPVEYWFNDEHLELLEDPPKSKKEEKPTQFQVGDIVAWGGVKGEVTSVGDDLYYPLRVTFGKEAYTYGFLHDGRQYDWHREPSLKLVERPKKKVRKTFYTGAYQSGTLTGYSVDGLLVESKEEALTKFKNYDMGIVEIVLEVEDV